MNLAFIYLVVLGLFLSVSSESMAQAVSAKKRTTGPLVASQKLTSKNSLNYNKPKAVVNKKTLPVRHHVQTTVHTKKTITFAKRPPKKSLSSDAFNQMIDSNERRTSAIKPGSGRGLASVPVGSQFEGETVVANSGRRNPVKYNSLLEEDRVEVKIRRAEEP